VTVERHRPFDNMHPSVTTGRKHVCDVLLSREFHKPDINVLVNGHHAVAAGLTGDEMELTVRGIAHGFLGITGPRAPKVGHDPDL
jgi:hypothetical protein